jgi:cyanophycinase-like exopeptidase
VTTPGEGRLRGRVALHGGGEFEAGDEPFLDALVAGAQPARDAALRIVVVPVAAARERPTASANHGIAALKRAAARAGIPAQVDAALVVDRDAAEDAILGARLAAADLIYLPGGHPDLVPAVLSGTLAWQSILAAHGRGAVVAGASAGAMGLAGRTWTPGGWQAGLGLVSGLIVVPHFAMFESNLGAWATAIDELEAAGFGRLGLDERTGIISTDGADGLWRVAGEGRAHWFPVGGGERVIAAHGETLTLARGKPHG